LQQDQHEALGKKAKAEAANKETIKKPKQLDAKTLGTTESLYKDVEFGGQLCLQVGIPLKPFCPSKACCRLSPAVSRPISTRNGLPVSNLSF
jgi:hypothetical protein